MAKTISIDALRKLKNESDTVPVPAASGRERRSPDSFVILLDEDGHADRPAVEHAKDPASQRRGSY